MARQTTPPAANRASPDKKATRFRVKNADRFYNKF